MHPLPLMADTYVVPADLPVMLSYAQNGEDVLLRRVLHEIKRGVYVDVGAQHPTVDSVTRHFYDQGWHGINLEPHPAYFAALQRERPRDINLNLAVSDHAGTANFHFVEDSGLSSLHAGALQVAAKHGLKSRTGQVVVKRLDAVLVEHDMPEIHFLKIDVEGAEREVLLGVDFERWRPWIMVIEATRPNDPAPCWDMFEPVALAARYQPVLFDGLNRWYLREESMSLSERFMVPINIFDRYLRWKEAAWDSAVARTEQRKPTSFATAFRK